MEHKYGLAINGKLLHVRESYVSGTYTLTDDYGEHFILPLNLMKAYLASPPSCRHNAWHGGIPFPSVDLSKCEVVEVSYRPIPLKLFLDSF